MEGMVAMRTFYQGKRILVTGHTGFKGTWLVSILNYLGAHVIGFALPDSETDFYNSACVEVKDYRGDIRNSNDILRVITKEEPEIIIHLASHSTVNKGQELTQYIFETNIMGVVHLFEAVRNTPSVKTVLVVTSDKCYRNLEIDEGYTEDYGFGAQDTYSASKAGQELIAECYRNILCKPEEHERINIATARASNVIGGGDFNRTRLFPSLLHSFINGETASIRNPKAIRPWQNVLDVLYGYLLLVKAMETQEMDKNFCSAFNFGPDNTSFITVQEVAELLVREFPGSTYNVSGKNQVIETNILKLNSDKAKKLLGWESRYDLKKTIHMTAEFERRFEGGESAKEICGEYIRDYFGGI